jgi:hypothetical protein
MFDFFMVEGTGGGPSEGAQNYLHQQAEPPEDLYDPENDGSYLSESLGVHEHWDTTEDIFSSERYSGPSNNGIDYIAYGEESLQADANGPYEGEIGEGIQFKGNATGGTLPYTWHWDFGNGDFSNEQNPVYNYTEAGEYTITLTVTDDLGLKGDDTTTATIIGPILSIDPITSGLFKIKTKIKNEGVEATGVNWKITLVGGAFIGKETSGTNDIPALGEITVTSNLIIGFGPTMVTVTAEVPESTDVREQSGFVLLFFIYVNPGGGV